MWLICRCVFSPKLCWTLTLYIWQEPFQLAGWKNTHITHWMNEFFKEGSGDSADECRIKKWRYIDSWRGDDNSANTKRRRFSIQKSGSNSTYGFSQVRSSRNRMNTNGINAANSVGLYSVLLQLSRVVSSLSGCRQPPPAQTRCHAVENVLQRCEW